MRRVSFAVIAVFVAWSLMDFVMHGVILASSYAATQALWRPMNEMKLTGHVHCGVDRGALLRLGVCSIFLPQGRCHGGCGMDYCSASVPGYRWAMGAIR